MNTNKKTHWSKYHPQHHGACGLVARFRKPALGGAKGTYGVLQRTLDSITTLQQRGGSVQTDWGTDGDGAGVLTDIPRRIIRIDLDRNGLNESLAGSVACGVFFLLPGAPKNTVEKIKKILRKHELEVLYDRPVPTNSEALGPMARDKEPEIIRCGILIKREKDGRKKLFDAQVEIDNSLDEVHVVSLSSDSIVYKVMGTGKTLERYYPELHNSQFKTSLAIGHIRMSTNTSPDFRLAHPYGTMVHNGEINTIDRLIRRAQALKIPLPQNPSDTMVVDRIIQYMIAETGCSIASAYRMLFPLVDSEIDILPDRERRLQSRLKIPFGNLGQGPAAIIARAGRQAIIACDAMALRPLWFGETEKEFYATSERGTVNFESNENSPRPVAGGEMVLLDLDNHREVSYPELVNYFEEDVEKMFAGPQSEAGETFYSFKLNEPSASKQSSVKSREISYLQALGFNSDDITNLREMADTGKEPLGSVGYATGNLAPVSDPENKLLADYCLEKVAVITNPALDSQREKRYFSLKVRFGDRQNFRKQTTGPCWEFPTPLLFSEQLDNLLEQLNHHDVEINNIFVGKNSGETQTEALDRIKEEALAGSEDFRVLFLNDSEVLSDKRGLLDPLLVLAEVTKSLQSAGLRANTGIILESRRIRNLHDVMLAYGMGAELICPVIIEQLCLDLQRARDAAGRRIELKELSETEKMQLRKKRLLNCFDALKTGMKKVISTMGIHELEGYGRIFSSVGLSTRLADMLEIYNYLGSDKTGLTLEKLEELEQKREQAAGEKIKRLPKEGSAYPGQIIKSLQAVADGREEYSVYEDKIKEYNKSPRSIRHCLNLKNKVKPAGKKVDLKTGKHRAPLFFAAMSYGSQNVIVFSAYAEAAKKLDILAVNGEGGEPPHLRGKLGHNRAQQIASGRFGVDTDLIANSNQIEIKIGQGAKPGEGGMLRGVKVNPHIAITRHTPPFIDLISPSNNHDLYSIEDLIPTLINEFRVLNPDVEVDIKVPAIPGLAPIVTGLAKEGHPDSITISGFEGSTGAARRHAMRRVGFPVELALNEAHRALARAGLRDRVELRVEGGMQSVDDMIKMGILGADRVGFGTLGMMAAGCIYCGNCFSNRCPRGISSPFSSAAEAQANGVKAFQPRDLATTIDRMVNFFGGMIDALVDRLAQLGVQSFSDLHNRNELLDSFKNNNLNLAELFKAVDYYQPPEQNEIIRDRLQTSISSDQRVTLATELDSRSAEDAVERLRFVTALETTDRAVGSGVSGELARRRRRGEDPTTKIKKVLIHPEESCVPGNGLGAFNEDGVEIVIGGGSQDGTAKSMSGGMVIVLPGENNMGKYLDGSVGKSAAYGATGGTLVVTGPWADSRFGVRCSGADLIHLGEVGRPLNDREGLINARANLKGFAFEYMTTGRGLILGDPGMDFASGMTGGVIYCRLNPDMGLTMQVFKKRTAPGVNVESLAEEDEKEICELLDTAARAVEDQFPDKAIILGGLKKKWQESFVKIVPQKQPTQQLTFFEDPMQVVEKAYQK